MQKHNFRAFLMLSFLSFAPCALRAQTPITTDAQLRSAFTNGGDYTLNTSITITGNQNNYTLASGKTLTITGNGTINRGSTSAGLRVNGGTLNLNGIAFNGNKSRYSATVSAIEVVSGTLNLTNCKVWNCKKIYNKKEISCGAGIYQQSGTMNITNSEITYNNLFFNYINQYSYISASNGYAYGGGVYVGGTATFTNTSISNNQILGLTLPACQGGGGVCVRGQATFNSCRITGNNLEHYTYPASNGRFLGRGGGILVYGDGPSTRVAFNSTGSKVSPDMVISGNKAYRGAGLCFEDFYLSDEDTDNLSFSGDGIAIKDNCALSSGGGMVIYALNAGTVDFSNALISGNKAGFRELDGEPNPAVVAPNSTGNYSGSQGGLHFTSSEEGQTIIKSLVVENCVCTMHGAGMYCGGKDLTVQNFTIRNNTVLNATGVINWDGAAGGGIFIGNGSNIKLEGCCILNNKIVLPTGETSSSGGGIKIGQFVTGWESNRSNVYIVNTLIKGNSSLNAGGVGVDGSIVHIQGCTITDNWSTTLSNWSDGTWHGGGGISATRATLIVEDYVTAKGTKHTVISGNYNKGEKGYRRGGGVFLIASSATFNNVQITDNGNVTEEGVTYTTDIGGGVYCCVNEFIDPLNLSFNGCTISGNTASSQGGGVFISAVTNHAEFTGTNTITNNTAGSYNEGDGGGGIYIQGKKNTTGTTDANIPVLIDGATLSNNTAFGRGGGLYVAEEGAGSGTWAGPTALVRNCTITGNFAKADPENETHDLGNGGGVYAHGSKLTSGSYTDGFLKIVGGSIVNNQAQQNGCTLDHNCIGNGGGLYAYAGTVMVSGTNIGTEDNANAADRNGGGVYIHEHADVTLNGSTSVAYNTAVNGGGIYTLGNLTMDGDEFTVNNNTATVNGGGINITHAEEDDPEEIGFLGTMAYSVGPNDDAFVDMGTFSYQIYNSSNTLVGDYPFDGDSHEELLPSGTYTIKLSKTDGISDFSSLERLTLAISDIDGSITPNGGSAIDNEAEITFTTYTDGYEICTFTVSAPTTLGGTLTMCNGATVKENTAVTGGGIFLGAGTAATLRGGNILSNTATSLTAEGNGGGVYINANAAMNVNGIDTGGVLIKYNHAKTAGGGVYKLGSLSVGGLVVITDNTVDAK